MRSRLAPPHVTGWPTPHIRHPRLAAVYGCLDLDRIVSMSTPRSSPNWASRWCSTPAATPDVRAHAHAHQVWASMSLSRTPRAPSCPVATVDPLEFTHTPTVCETWPRAGRALAWPQVANPTTAAERKKAAEVLVPPSQFALNPIWT